MRNYDDLAEAYHRLRAAAKAVCEAASYPHDGETGEARIYRSQLADLERELDGTPQPHSKFATMSPS